MTTTTASLRGYPVALGDGVVLHGANLPKDQPRPRATINKIGRTRLGYMSIYDRQEYIDMGTGKVSDFTYAMTLAEETDVELSKDLLGRMAKFGLGRVGYGKVKVPVDKLSRIVAILEEEV